MSDNVQHPGDRGVVQRKRLLTTGRNGLGGSLRMSLVAGAGLMLVTGCGAPVSANAQGSVIANRTPVQEGNATATGTDNTTGATLSPNNTSSPGGSSAANQTGQSVAGTDQSTSASSDNSSPELASVDMVSTKDGWAFGQIDGRHALWRSQYNGVVWARVPLPFTAPTVSQKGMATSTLGTDTLFAANVASGGVKTYKTTDDGKTWAALGTANTTDTMVSYFHFINPSDGWMVTDDGVAMHQSQYHLYGTTDGGKSWNLLAETGTKTPTGIGTVPGYGDAHFTFDAKGVGWMTGQSVIDGKTFLLRSADGGKTWKDVAVPVPTTDASTLVSTSKPVYQNGMFSIVVQYQGHNRNETVVMRLNGQGQVVSTSPALKTTKPVATDFINLSDGWATTAPWAPNHPEFYQTVDGGQTWKSLGVNQQMMSTDPRIQFVSPNEGFAFARNQGTGEPNLWRTVNGGQSWQPSIMKIYSQGGPTPPGQNPPPPAPQFSPNAIDFVSDEVGYLVGAYGNGDTEVGRVYKTTDGGKDWSKIYEGGSDISAIDARGNEVWMDVGALTSSGVPQGTLMLSTDGGQHFQRISREAMISIDFVSKTEGFGVSASGSFRNKLLHTTDGGRTWTDIPLPAPQTNGGSSAPQGGSSAPAGVGSPHSVSFANSLDGILLQTGEPGAGQQPKSILETSDGGKTWSFVSSVGMDGNAGPKQLSSGGYADGIDLVPGHPLTAYIWESRGPLELTSDGGRTWTASRLTEPDAMEASSVSMQGAQDGYVLVHDMRPGQMGFVLEKTTDGMKSWTKVHTWP